ncbi:hypothetical protein DCC85_21550 [Paenibacillus sp. CAA11]|uniref:LTA synthase family protein n=1 Tax=Paenibacillus sp. CAA11 TaxID=1532905 RepID=UPI000D3C0E61|nr:alkaline phosphatase family protein [Paenibacillus sp. CAA11]AWB46497.1 hypothetical protein DCC85_21550 [Paenibacillus sp. CAA11]
MRQLFIPTKRTGILLLSLLFGGFVLNFIMQAASLDMNVTSVFNWISEHAWLYVFGGVFFFCVLLLFASLLPNVYTGAVIAFLVCVLLGIADYKKLSTTGEPLFPWDLMQLKNAQEMSRITKGMISPLAIVISVLIIIGLIYLILKLPKIRISLPLRGIFIAVSLILTFLFVQMLTTQHKIIKKIQYQPVYWNQKVNYANNGLLFAFTGNLRQNLMEKPEGYSKSAIEEIAKKYAALPDPAATKSPAEQPNIVFMMDEAFFDPTRLTGIKLSEDPLSFIHEKEKSSPGGFLLSPEFGGNTANVEFEALTGMSMYFLNGGSIPYQQRIVKMSSLPSIASILKDRGYQALALHPFDKTFYNRNQVYPIMGFDRFTGEKDMKQIERMSPDAYVSDMSAVKEVLKELKESEKPTFLHLVTMQNHFPFTKGVNGPNTVTAEGVDAQYKNELETYVQDTKLTDQALAYLSEELKSLKRPTIVVFWGDHLPALSGGIYTKAGWDTNPRLKHETKLLYMANFDIGKDPLGTVSPAFLGPSVFQLTGQDLPTYYKLLAKVKEEIPGLSKNVLVNESGVLPKLTEQQQALLNDYRLVVYDILAGQNYSKSLMF